MRHDLSMEDAEKKINKLRDNREFSAALDIVNDVLSDNPEDFSMLCSKCLLLEDLQNFNGALEISEKLLELSSECVDCYFYKARISFKLKLYEKAIETIIKYIHQFGGKSISDLETGTDDQELIDIYYQSRKHLEIDTSKSPIDSNKNKIPRYPNSLKITEALLMLFPNYSTRYDYLTILKGQHEKIREIKYFCKNNFGWMPTYEQIKDIMVKLDYPLLKKSVIEKLNAKKSNNILFSLYHITHLDNLKKILELGLMSHDSIIHDNPKRISSQSIMNMRCNIFTPEQKPLSQYVNLYFNPRNSMLYRVKKEQEQTKQSDNIIILEFLEDIFREKILISDGNCAHSKTQIFKSLLSEETMGIINRARSIRDWTHDAEDKRIQCAECLIPDIFSSEKIHNIHVQNTQIKENVNLILNSINNLINRNRINIIVNHDMFFG